MAALVATGISDASSSAFTLAAGDSVTLSLTTPTDPDIPPGIEAIVKLQTSAATYIQIGRLNKDNPRLVLNAPGTYQVFRRASVGGFGVDIVQTSVVTRAAATATIANGASVSGSIDLTSTALLGFIAPAGWTAAALNIEVSADGTNWASTIYDQYGVAAGSYSSLTVGAAYAVDAVTLLPWRYARLRSGTSGVPVNQGAQRDFTVVTRPLA